MGTNLIPNAVSNEITNGINVAKQARNNVCRSFRPGEKNKTKKG
jgi:hypothetical protein